MTITNTDFRYIADVVEKTSSIQLPDGKQYLVEARLLPLARSMGLDSVNSLVAQMRAVGGAAVRARVVDAMTTNETWWFRDDKPFAALGKHIIPELVQRRAAQKRISVWSAACSTGQEPYSIAMVAQQALAGRRDTKVDITATDLSAEVLLRARAARYTDMELGRGMPADLRTRYFARVGGEWQLRDDIRSMVTFRPINLTTVATALPGFDVVFLRNVLIYFDLATKKRVLANVRRVLRPDGYLFLGSAETTMDVDPAFERVFVGGAICYRLANRSGA